MRYIASFYGEYVNEHLQKEALERLQQRIKNGESPYDILQIKESEKFYVDKLVNGSITFSPILYNRIMTISKEELKNGRK